MSYPVTKTFQNFLFFFFAVVLGKVFGTVSAFFYAKLLSPSDYGVWLTLMLIYTYSPIICLGTVEALLKQYPYFIGLGDKEKAARVETGVFGSIILSACLLVVIGMISLLIFKSYFIPYNQFIVLMILATVEGHLACFFYYRFTAHQDFKIVSVLDTIRSMSTFLFVALGAWIKGIQGATLGFCINELSLLFISYNFNKRKYGAVKPDFHFTWLLELVKIGFPITIIWWFYMLEMSVDRMLSMKMLGKEATGFYGLGGSLVSLLVLIPMSLGRVLYPRINEEVGKKTSGVELQRFVIQPAQPLTLLLAFLIGILILGAPIIFHSILPKYEKGLISAQILLLGSFFVCQIRNSINYLVAINKQNHVLYFVLLSLAINIALSVLFIRIGLYIEGIALATGIAGFILATIVWIDVFYNLGLSLTNQLKEIGKLYLPFFIVLLFLVILWAYFPQFLQGNYKSTAVYEAFFIGFFLIVINFLPPLNQWTKDFILIIQNNLLKKSRKHLSD